MTEPVSGAERDPVCGMTVAPDSPHVARLADRTYRFCNPRCAERFRADPARWLGDAPKPAVHAAGVPHTCPMHPEIVQDGPGSCPICGMALEPVAPSLDEGPSPELVDMRRRLAVSAALALALVAIAMAEMLPFAPLHDLAASRALAWIELGLAAPVVLWGGAPFFARGAASVRNGRFNMFTLIALGTGAAFGASVVATLAPELIPA